jgi:hypothetical protein
MHDELAAEIHLWAGSKGSSPPLLAGQLALQRGKRAVQRLPIDPVLPIKDCCEQFGGFGRALDAELQVAG